jgi:hypothetical protein
VAGLTGSRAAGLRSIFPFPACGGRLSRRSQVSSEGGSTTSHSESQRGRLSRLAKLGTRCPLIHNRGEVVIFPVDRTRVEVGGIVLTKVAGKA